MIGIFRRKAPPELRWSVRYAVWQSVPEHRGPSKPADLMHFAQSRLGVFRIYDDCENFLLSYPRAIGRPAELHKSLGAAKTAANDAMEHYD